MDRPDPATLELHRTWTVYMKSNSDEWVKKNFKHVMDISTVKDMWTFLNNVPSVLTGQYNIFMMEKGLIPLWENHKDLFENGGCWSTIIRGYPWESAMKEIFMAMVGELQFDVWVGTRRSLMAQGVRYFTCETDKGTLGRVRFREG